jgi:hypothetical protein
VIFYKTQHVHETFENCMQGYKMPPNTTSNFWGHLFSGVVGVVVEGILCSQILVYHVSVGGWRPRLPNCVPASVWSSRSVRRAHISKRSKRSRNRCLRYVRLYSFSILLRSLLPSCQFSNIQTVWPINNSLCLRLKVLRS